MLWRTGEQVLVQQGDSFVLVDATGSIVMRFDPRATSDEDDLWQTTYQVVGDALIERTSVQHGDLEPRIEDAKVVRGLRVARDPEAAQLAERGAEDARATEARDAQRAEARLAAIPGARMDLELGPEVARAQAALCARIHAWDDRLAAGLLETLLELARARPSAPVLVAYARGCLLACFELAVPALVAATPIVGRPELAARLTARALELDAAAERQDAADARANARAYRDAAASVRVAAGLVEDR